MAIDFPERMGRDEQGVALRTNFPPYLRTMSKQLQNEFNGNYTRWGNEDTYGHTRRIPHRGKYGNKGGTNDISFASPPPSF